MKRQDVIFPVLVLVLCALLTYIVLSTTLLDFPQSYTTLPTFVN
jgi:hypothetical protein